MSEMVKIISKVILEATREDGTVRGYLSKQKKWEGKQRKDFSDFREILRRGVIAEIQQVGVERLRELNASYRTRFPGRCVPGFVEVVANHLTGEDWGRKDPTILFADDVDISATQAFIPKVLDALYRDPRVHRHGYSLLTKFLHFIYPESFPIYDSQAAASIQMWSYFEYRKEAPGKHAWGTLADLSGHGYAGVMDFYTQFWSSATQDHRKQLTDAAEQRQSEIGGRVTALDLVDKLLWQAAGHPVHLGLLTP